MAKRWLGVTLIAAGLGLVPTARAQYLPCPSAPQAMPEPMPMQPSVQKSSNTPSMPTPAQNGPAYPGPLNGMLAPHGPSGEKIELPPDTKNAFPECPEWDNNGGFYAGLGALALQRQGLGHLPVAVRDPQNLDTGIPPTFVQFPPLQMSLNQISTTFAFGPRVTLGWFQGPEAIELTGYYIPDHHDSVSRVDPGRLDSFFINPPLGLEGDNNMWLQADEIRVTERTQIGSVELNYRTWGTMYNQIEYLFGLRYFDLLDRVDIYTDDDGFTIRDIIGRPDPTRQADYVARAHTHLIGPQLGWEGNLPLCGWLSIGAKAKGCWGANIVDVQRVLTRGDGFVGFKENCNEVQFSSLYELGLFVDWFIWERGRLHVGYDAMFLVHAPEAQNEIEYNLAQPLGSVRENGNIFFHGPVLEMQILW
jgi:hypothetical protein